MLSTPGGKTAATAPRALQGGQRGELGDLDDHGVAGHQRGADLAARQADREVPRDDGRDDSDGLPLHPQAAGVVVEDFVGRATRGAVRSSPASWPPIPKSMNDSIRILPFSAVSTGARSLVALDDARRRPDQQGTAFGRWGVPPGREGFGSGLHRGRGVGGRSVGITPDHRRQIGGIADVDPVIAGGRFATNGHRRLNGHAGSPFSIRLSEMGVGDRLQLGVAVERFGGHLVAATALLGAADRSVWDAARRCCVR